MKRILTAIAGIVLLLVALGVIFEGLGPIFGNMPDDMAWCLGILAVVLIALAASAQIGAAKNAKRVKKNGGGTRTYPAPPPTQKKAGTSFPRRWGSRRNEMGPPYRK